MFMKNALVATSMATASALIALPATAEVLTGFELGDGHNLASSFLIAGESGQPGPLAVDDWFALAADHNYDQPARITPDPVPAFLGGTAQSGVLQGLQSAAVDLDGQLAAKPFEPGSIAEPIFTVSYQTRLGAAPLLRRRGLFGPPQPSTTQSDFRVFDGLLRANGDVDRNAVAVAGVRFRRVPQTIQVLSDGAWQDTGIQLGTNHTQRVDIVIDAFADVYEVFLTDLVEPNQPTFSIGAFTTNTPVVDDADAIAARGGVSLSSIGGVALFDQIEVDR